MNAVDGLVNNLDDPEILDEMLLRTGANHARRKITAEAFEVGSPNLGHNQHVLKFN